MPKILWISDIHLKGTPQEPTKVMISKFVEALEKFDKFEFLVISGDIAFSGDKKDGYDKFNELIIEKIQDKIDNVICVPGNHDVSWKEVKKEIIFRNFIEDNNDVFSKISNLKLNEEYYESVFRNYREFHSKIENVQSQTKVFTNVTNYDSHNILFITINSSWLSIGMPLKEVKQIIKFNTINHILTSTDKSQTFSEFGNQVYGFSIDTLNIEFDNITKKIKEKYQDYYKIMVAHHPPNWLSWKEMYSDNPASNSRFQNFMTENKIDLLMVAHEHTSNTIGDVLFGRTLVLKSGMFLNHNEKHLSNCRFKVLEFDSDNFDIKEKSFQYHNVADNKHWDNESIYNKKYLRNSLVNLFKTEENKTKIENDKKPPTPAIENTGSNIYNINYLNSVISPIDEIDKNWSFTNFLQDQLNVSVKLSINETNTNEFQLYEETANNNEFSLNSINYYYLICNINDILIDFLVENSKESTYIYKVLEHIKKRSYIMYVYILLGL